MKLRLPTWLSRSSDDIPSLGIMDPGPALRIIDPSDEVEAVRRVPNVPASPTTVTSSGAASVRTPPPPPMEAGYRWGLDAARQPCDLAGDDAPGDRPLPVQVITTTDHLPAPRFERAVLAVAARTEVLAGAVARLQHQLDEIDDRFVDVVHHHDLVELESRRAKLAAEVSRLSVELKSEVDRRLSEVARAIATEGRRAPSVNQRGPLDLADARRVEVHLDFVEQQGKVADIESRRTA